MTDFDFLERVVELIHGDPELRQAIIDAIEAYRRAEVSRAAWYDRRGRNE